MSTAQPDLDFIVTERLRAQRNTAADLALNVFLDVCPHCSTGRKHQPLCPECGAVRTDAVPVAAVPAPQWSDDAGAWLTWGVSPSAGRRRDRKAVSA